VEEGAGGNQDSRTAVHRRIPGLLRRDWQASVNCSCLRPLGASWYQCNPRWLPLLDATVTTAKDRNHRLDRMARFEGESGGEKKEEEDEALMLIFPVANGGVLSLRLLRIIRGHKGPLLWGDYVGSLRTERFPHGRTKHRVGILAVLATPR